MKTSDVYLSAALLSLGYTLDRINRADPHHMIFEFSAIAKTGALDELSQAGMKEVELQWANKLLQVNAFEFAEAIKRMKSIIHSGS